MFSTVKGCTLKDGDDYYRRAQSWKTPLKIKGGLGNDAAGRRKKTRCVLVVENRTGM